MKKTMARVMTVLALAAGAAGAQPAAVDAVYDLSQNAVSLGRATVRLTAVDGGYVSTSSVEVGGVISLTDELVAGPDGAASSYRVAGTMQGVPVEVTAELRDGVVALSLTQAGQTQALELPAEGPVYVVDNNFVDGLQLLVGETLRRPDRRLEATVLVPLGGAVGSVALTVREGTEPYEGGREAVVVDAVMMVRGQMVPYVVRVDEEGVMLSVDVPLAGARFTRVETAVEVEEADEAETAEEALARTGVCVVERELHAASGGETLYGRLTLPAEPPASGAPTLLLLPGSGAVDVDGNAAPAILNSGYRQLAQALGCAGYGVLRVAKMGVPPSTGDGNAATLQSYAGDVAAWFDVLSGTEGVDASRLGLMGHSEGGLVALYAVAQGYVEPDVVVLIAAAGRTFADLLAEQLAASALRGGLGEEGATQYVDWLEELLDAVRASEGQALELTEDLADNAVAPLFAAAAGLLRSEIDVDPTELAAAVTVPALVVQGLKDVQVRQVDGQLLAAALPRATHLELPDLTHNLVDTRLDAEAKLLPAPTDAVSETLLTALATYLHGTLKLAR